MAPARHSMVMDAVDLVSLAARLWMGTVMLAHGWNHGRNLEGTASWFAKVGFRQPMLNARLSFLNELAIGAAVIAGLLTSVALAGLVATMVVAFWSIHRFAGFFVFHRPDEGYEYVATLAMLALVIATVGPGAYSLDSVIGIDMSGALGAAIIGLGVVAGAAQLAVFWRKPEKESTE